MSGWPYVLELAVGALMLIVFAVGVLGRRPVGIVATAGVGLIAAAAFMLTPSGPALGGMYVQDGLAIFVKRVFLAATFIGLLSGLGSTDRAMTRRSTEYHLLLLGSLLGMLVLASARDLVLLFVAFELMSIPLYVLTGFAKREAEAVEASLKFFLVGSVSSAVMAYGLSFVYGATGSTSLAVVARASASPLLMLGLIATLAGLA
ncbi:MAG TPA: proton-conducting transporter membrane subunit, partial [Casimicrobiaceae bacterium]|nr:proton-conducting transporter membrane subunit [Casimicrobiaceae bacterium]